MKFKRTLIILPTLFCCPPSGLEVDYTKDFAVGKSRGKHEMAENGIITHIIVAMRWQEIWTKSCRRPPKGSPYNK